MKVLKNGELTPSIKFIYLLIEGFVIAAAITKPGHWVGISAGLIILMQTIIAHILVRKSRGLTIKVNKEGKPVATLIRVKFTGVLIIILGYLVFLWGTGLLNLLNYFF